MNDNCTYFLETAIQPVSKATRGVKLDENIRSGQLAQTFHDLVFFFLGFAGVLAGQAASSSSIQVSSPQFPNSFSPDCKQN